MLQKRKDLEIFLLNIFNDFQWKFSKDFVEDDQFYCMNPRLHVTVVPGRLAGFPHNGTCQTWQTSDYPGNNVARGAKVVVNHINVNERMRGSSKRRVISHGNYINRQLSHSVDKVAAQI